MLHMLVVIVYSRGSHSVLRGSQGIRNQLREDPWVHFRNDYFEVQCFVKNSNKNPLVGSMLTSYDR